jgi:hypothetical protein
MINLNGLKLCTRHIVEETIKIIKKKTQFDNFKTRKLKSLKIL